jgi:fatty-acyl-CoA synthase
MHHRHLLDRLIGSEWPDLSTPDALRAFESTPYTERIAARSIDEALQRGAAHDPEAAAMHFLPNADPEGQPITTTRSR